MARPFSRPQTRPAAAAVQTMKTDVLEPRQMLAGHMNAWAANGILTVNGDATANDLDVVIDADGGVTLDSVNSRITGSEEPLFFSGEDVTTINVRLGHGYDNVTVRSAGDEPARVAGALRVLAQHGIDDVHIENVSVGGGLRVEGGVDNDAITLQAVDAAAVTVVGASGVDAISMKQVYSTGRMFLYAGTGSDRIAVEDIEAAVDRVRVYGGDGHDWIAADNFDEVIAAGQQGNNTIVREVRNGSDAVVAASIAAEVKRRTGRDGAATALDLTAFPDGTRFPEPSLIPNSEGGFYAVGDSGILVRIVGESTGAAKPTLNSTVTVNYEGRLLDGTIFDSSYARQQPASFGLRNLIRGWQRTVPLMEPGQKIQMFLPPSEAYGANGRPGIPGNSTLMFSMELISFADPA